MFCCRRATSKAIATRLVTCVAWFAYSQGIDSSLRRCLCVLFLDICVGSDQTCMWSARYLIEAGPSVSHLKRHTRLSLANGGEWHYKEYRISWHSSMCACYIANMHLSCGCVWNLVSCGQPAVLLCYCKDGLGASACFSWHSSGRLGPTITHDSPNKGRRFAANTW